MVKRGFRLPQIPLWMHEILHHLRHPGMMIALKIPTHSGLSRFLFAVRNGFRNHPHHPLVVGIPKSFPCRSSRSWVDLQSKPTLGDEMCGHQGVRASEFFFFFSGVPSIPILSRGPSWTTDPETQRKWQSFEKTIVKQKWGINSVEFHQVSAPSKCWA